MDGMDLYSNNPLAKYSNKYIFRVQKLVGHFRLSTLNTCSLVVNCMHKL